MQEKNIYILFLLLAILFLFGLGIIMLLIVLFRIKSFTIQCTQKYNKLPQIINNLMLIFFS